MDKAPLHTYAGWITYLFGRFIGWLILDLHVTIRGTDPSNPIWKVARHCVGADSMKRLAQCYGAVQKAACVRTQARRTALISRGCRRQEPRRGSARSTVLIALCRALCVFGEHACPLLPLSPTAARSSRVKRVPRNGSAGVPAGKTPSAM